LDEKSGASAIVIRIMDTPPLVVTSTNALVQQHDEIAQYSRDVAPNNPGKNHSTTPQFHAVALQGAAFQ
jgi:hypothetical protein